MITEKHKHWLEIGAVVVGILALAYLIKNHDQQAVSSAAGETFAAGTAGNPTAAAGSSYLNWNYPSQGGGLPSVAAYGTNPQGVTNSVAPCGCSSGGGQAGTQFFADEQSVMAYYGSQMKDFASNYLSDVVSSLPPNFAQYVQTGSGGASF